MNWFDFFGRSNFDSQTYLAIGLMLGLIIVGGSIAFLLSRRKKNSGLM